MQSTSGYITTPLEYENINYTMIQRLYHGPVVKVIAIIYSRGHTPNMMCGVRCTHTHVMPLECKQNKINHYKRAAVTTGGLALMTVCVVTFHSITCTHTVHCLMCKYIVLCTYTCTCTYKYNLIAVYEDTCRSTCIQDSPQSMVNIMLHKYICSTCSSLPLILGTEVFVCYFQSVNSVMG